jgi:hypothetical protein
MSRSRAIYFSILAIHSSPSDALKLTSGDLSVARELGLEIAAIQELTRSFAADALGLTLGSPIVDDREFPARCQQARERDPTDDRPVWCAWKTDRGAIAVLARYDEVQSARVRAHVLRFAWWIGEEHHDSWYYAYPKFPGEWTAGSGRPNRW